MTTFLARRAFVGAGLSVAALPSAVRAQAGDAVRIGVLTDLAGPYSDSGGQGSVLAARMAVQDFGGTVLGRPVEVLAGDTQNKPDIASSLARGWYDSGVDAIADLPVTPIAAAVQQVAREKGRSVLIAAATANELTNKTCAPVSTMWIDDNHSLVSATARAVGGNLGRRWGTTGTRTTPPGRSPGGSMLYGRRCPRRRRPRCTRRACTTCGPCRRLAPGTRWR